MIMVLRPDEDGVAIGRYGAADPVQGGSVDVEGLELGEQGARVDVVDVGGA